MKDRNGNKVRVGDEVCFCTHTMPPYDESLDAIGTVVKIIKQHSCGTVYWVAHIVRDNNSDDQEHGSWHRECQEILRA